MGAGGGRTDSSRPLSGPSAAASDTILTDTMGGESEGHARDDRTITKTL